MSGRHLNYPHNPPNRITAVFQEADNYPKRKTLLGFIARSLQRLKLEKSKAATKDADACAKRVVSWEDGGSEEEMRNDAVLNRKGNYARKLGEVGRLANNVTSDKDKTWDTTKSSTKHRKTKLENSQELIDLSCPGYRDEIGSELVVKMRKTGHCRDGLHGNSSSPNSRRLSYPPQFGRHESATGHHFFDKQNRFTYQRRIKLVKSCPMLRGESNGHWQQRVVIQNYRIETPIAQPSVRRQRKREEYEKQRKQKSEAQNEPKPPKPPSWQSLAGPSTKNNASNYRQRVPSKSYVSDSNGDDEKSETDELDSDATIYKSNQSDDNLRRLKTVKKIKRTQRRKIKNQEIPEERNVVQLAEAKPREYHLKETHFDSHIYLKENEDRCRQWLQTLREGSLQKGAESPRAMGSKQWLQTLEEGFVEEGCEREGGSKDFTDERWAFVSSPYPVSLSSASSNETNRKMRPKPRRKKLRRKLEMM